MVDSAIAVLHVRLTAVGRDGNAPLVQVLIFNILGTNDPEVRICFRHFIERVGAIKKDLPFTLCMPETGNLMQVNKIVNVPIIFVVGNEHRPVA
jgi:hypothetical protein